MEVYPKLDPSATPIVVPARMGGQRWAEVGGDGRRWAEVGEGGQRWAKVGGGEGGGGRWRLKGVGGGYPDDPGAIHC